MDTDMPRSQSGITCADGNGYTCFGQILEGCKYILSVCVRVRDATDVLIRF